MIGPSRRQRASTLPPDKALALHTRIAARSAWNARLLRASAAAVLASTVMAALASRPWLQAAVLSAAFMLGAALPVQGHRTRALRYIRNRSGLSYETALELGARDDPFGYVDAVRTRAVASVRDLRPPDLPAWWIPVLAAALALLLVPLTSRDTRAPAPTASPVSAPTEGSPSDSQSQAAAAPPAAAPQRAAAGAAQPSQSGGQADASPPASTTTDQQVLSDYLRNLGQETPPGSGSATPSSPTSQAGAGNRPSTDATGPSRAGRTGTDAQSGGADAASGLPQQNTTSGTGSTGSAEGGSTTSGAGSPGSGTSVNGSPSANPPSSTSSAAPGSAPGNAPAGPDGAGQPSDQGSQGQAASGAQAGGASQAGSAGVATDAQGAGAGAVPGADRGTGSGAGGNQPGQPSAPSASVPASPSAPQFLPGTVRGDAQTSGGTVRLPGSTDVTLPPGTSIETYRRAAEQALTEGDVPLEYQEVFRRYFR